MSRLGDIDWVEGSQITGPLRIVKDEGEVASLRAAAHAADKVATRIPGEVRFSGRTEAEVAADIKRMLVEEGHRAAEFAIVGSGPNGASPHHEPGERVIGEGEVVVCDFGGTWDGYHSDLTRTFSVGEPDATALDVHRAVHEANRAGREAVAPGIPCEEIDRAARKVVEEAGYGEFFIHRTGHGIGLEVHEHPYLVEGNTDPLAPGMAFSVEPGVYLPGRMGVRIEDIIVCGANSADELNEASRDLVVVE
jgi:Xaa-Pro aminopeptidase